MSNCANIINRLFSEVCTLREREAKAGFMLDILQVNQSIFERLDTTVYIVKDSATTNTICGLPITVQPPTGSSYKGLVILNKHQPGVGTDCIIYSTKNSADFGERNSSGLFNFTKSVSLEVVNVDINVLNNVDQAQVVAALRACVDTTSNSTVSCDAYDALVSFLYKYGIRSVSPSQAACIYKNLSSKLVTSVETSSVEVASASAPVSHSETISTQVPAVVAVSDEVASYQVSFEPHSPYEPHAPFEPSDLVSNVYVRQLQDSTISESLSNNDSIELKLKALLEATETSEQTD